jgi:hypothetical protein
MKLKIFFPTFFFLFLAQAFSAQIPDYLANGSKWRINSLSAWGECWTQSKYVVEITGDTTIGSYTYKKMIHHGLNSFMAPFPNPNINCNPAVSFSSPYAFIRQDNLKLYMREIYEQNDTLLYDFDLQIGDTLPMSFNNSANNITVSSISALQVGTETRKVFHLNQGAPLQNDSLIEGIGHVGGLIGPFNPFEYSEELVCFALNTTIYYQNMGLTCDLNVGVVEIAPKFEIAIFPNPTMGNLTIQTEHSSEIKSIEAINLLGNEVILDFSIQGEKEVDVKLHELNNGFYTIRVMNTLDQIFMYKVIKE